MKLLLVIIELIVADLILGGDNAIVISMATKNLPKDLRLKASVYGAIAAMALRLVFIFIVIKFGEMHLMFVNLVAGLLLIKVAIDLIGNGEENVEVTQASNLFNAVKSIVIADAVMSFDNAIVIASIATSKGFSAGVEGALIVVALLISFPIILFGASILTKVIDKFHFVIYIFGILLIHIGVSLVSHDSIFTKMHLVLAENSLSVLTWVVSAGIFVVAWFFTTKDSKEEK